MKLALVSAKYPFGGREPYLNTELRALTPYFDSIVVFPTSPETTVLGFTDVPAAVERRGLFALHTWRDALSALAMRPRACIAAVAELLSGPYRWGVKLKNIAVIPSGLALGFRLSRGGFGHVHSYWLSTPASVAFLGARVAGIDWSSTGHLWDIYENNALATKLTSARFVRAISERGRDDLLATPGCARAPIVVVHVGVDLPARPPAHVSLDGRPFTLLCAANLVPKKGHADLLAALSMLVAAQLEFRCTIAGDGELRGKLQALARTLGLDSYVTFSGHVQHAALLGEIGAGNYDAMVLASVELPGGVMEGIPVALMEAMALGLPVISTATGSITELVDDGCGRIVPQGDATALADSIRELATDTDLRARLARAAYERVATRFNVRGVARTLAELIAGHAPNAQ